MLTDAHAHFSGPGELAARASVRTVFCGTNPATAEQALALRDAGFFASCGVHPWQAGKVGLPEMLPFIDRSDALGEIGLDSVWTDADMAAQRKVFVEQLEYAQQKNLPVILHTKGMEGEIARILRRYDVPKLVHWYSCGEHLSDYLDQGCYFTVGPDHRANPAVQAVIRRAPLDLILTETDGLDAVAWALGHPVTADAIGDVLRDELRAIAATHGISASEAEDRVAENLERLLGKSELSCCCASSKPSPGS